MDSSLLQLLTIVLSIFIGVCLFILARYSGIPVIILLLTGGIILGPEFLGLIDPASLGKGLRLVILMCVALILFEGGLTLHPKGMKQDSAVIWRLLTLGVVITWLGTATLLYFLLDFPISFSLLAGSLVIVTGPTVITPMLKRIRIKEKLHHILHWESVLIDPIGVFIAILCFEWLSIEGHFLMQIGLFSYRLLIGVVLGYLGGKLITVLLQKDIIPGNQSNIFVFAAALFLFGISELIEHEAGILTVVVAGLVVGWADPPRLKSIKQFKSELTEIAIALVFLLLAANLELQNFSDLGWGTALTLAGILFLIRPVSIMLCSLGSTLTFNERFFLSWIAPRGVVAGSMASLFGIEMMGQGHSAAKFLETFTFSVIAATIILQGGTAGLLAQILNLKESEKKNWLIIGAHLFSRKIADFISSQCEGQCVFIDTNADAIGDTKEQGYRAFEGNALSDDVIPAEISSSIGYVLALTDNRDLNQLICEKWSETIDKENLYRWSSHSAEIGQKSEGIGQPVWVHLSKPSQISYDVRNKEILFQQHTNMDENFKIGDSVFLMTEKNGKISFRMPKEFSGREHFLIFEKIPRHLAGYISHKNVIEVEARSYQKVLSLALEQAHQLYPQFSFEAISQQLLEREREFPTTLANGIAAPHLHAPILSKPICFIVRIPGPIDLKTYDGQTVQLLFLLISPENEPEMHLRLLAEIAKIASNASLVQKLIDAPSSEVFIDLIKQEKS
jgi:NhaP-type Na+/H+ or K+/H+ antiporter/mannitol/fructose-specific phosphotransferase system IIA component (Ntr-type)